MPPKPEPQIVPGAGFLPDAPPATYAHGAAVVLPAAQPVVTMRDMVRAGIERDLARAASAWHSVADPFRRLFAEGGWQRGPQDPQAADDMRDTLFATGLGATGLPRPAGSIGAFGKLPLAEDLATPGKYANARKPLDWGGASKLAQARTAERKGAPAADMWERYGWARQAEPGEHTYNRLAHEQYGVEPGQWYMEYGSSPKQMGDRYDLSIGERRRTAPWATGEPEQAFEAEVRFDHKAALEAAADARFPDLTKQIIAEQAERVRAGPADRLRLEYQEAEKALRARGYTDEQIALEMNTRAGLGHNSGVSAHDLGTGNVWWKEPSQLGETRDMGMSARIGSQPLSPEQRATVLSLADQGMTAGEISRHLGIEQTKIGAAIQSAKPHVPTPERYSRAGVEELVALPDLTGLSVKEAAEKAAEVLGKPVKEKTIYWARQQAAAKGVELPRMGGRSAGAWSDEAIAIMSKAAAEGANASEIAARLNEQFPAFGGKLNANAVRLRRSKLGRGLRAGGREK